MFIRCFSYDLFSKELYKIGIFRPSTKPYLGIIQPYLPVKFGKIQEVHVRVGLQYPTTTT